MLTVQHPELASSLLICDEADDETKPEQQHSVLASPFNPEPVILQVEATET